MKILVIFTGGTIGSTVKKGWLTTDDSTNYTLLEKFEYSRDEIEFVTTSPYSVLSENLSSKEINLLQKEIIENLDKDFDGIIVTHGTDTLQYAASAVEYAISDCKIPVVFVSSDFPLENEKSNGFINFEAAVAFIKSKSSNGVFVSYKNDNESQTNIYVASRILQHGECNSNIYSIDEMPYATYDGNIALTGIKLAESTVGLGAVSYTEDSNILLIDSHPGDGYLYSLENIKAVLLKPYHSATLDTANTKLHDFCKRAKERSVPVFVVNIKPGISYESTKLFEEMNIISLPYSTYISAYMKIWAALSLDQDAADFVKNPIANEILPL